MWEWKNKNAIYQIYPRSFQDSDGDGVGDLRGIIQRLDYLKGRTDSLGVDAIWLSPFYTSPMVDFGYDVSNYYDVDPLFGTLDDFRDLVARAKELDIAVLVDLVPNHTSSEHPWFKAAQASPQASERDYYIFREGKGDGAPNNWQSAFGGSAWSPADHGGYYLHSFAQAQPDLNWENETVQREFQKIVRFWLELGVEGFRVDAVRWLGKDYSFEDEDASMPAERKSRYSQNMDRYLAMLTSVLDYYPKAIMVFEDSLDPALDTKAQIKRMYDIHDRAAPLGLQLIDSQASSRNVARILSEQNDIFPRESAVFNSIGNHDNSRVMTRLGEGIARLYAVMQLTTPGLPVIYYGEELGLADETVSAESAADIQYVQSPNMFNRDRARGVMRWGSFMGLPDFSEGTPWLERGLSDARTVQDEIQDPTAMLGLYKTLLSLRKTNEELRTGKYHQAYLDDDLLMYDLSSSRRKILVVLNFSDHARVVKLPVGGEVLLGSYTPDDSGCYNLPGYQYLVVAYATW